VAAIVDGGPVNDGPSAWNLRTGGVFFDAASRKGSTI